MEYKFVKKDELDKFIIGTLDVFRQYIYDDPFEWKNNYLTIINTFIPRNINLENDFSYMLYLVRDKRDHIYAVSFAYHIVIKSDEHGDYAKGYKIFNIIINKFKSLSTIDLNCAPDGSFINHLS